MVYYYNVLIPQEYEDEEYTIHLGKDKFENYELVNHSNKNDLWFHVKDLSSAHIYLQHEDFNNVPQEILNIIGQLTKANSIKGTKLPSVKIIYTPVYNVYNSNTSLQDKGVVSFHNENLVKTYEVGKKDNLILNKLEKSKKEISTEDFIKQQQETLRLLKQKQRQEEQEQKQYNMEQKKIKKTGGYDDLFKNTEGTSNDTRNENWDEDEFW